MINKIMILFTLVFFAMTTNAHAAMTNGEDYQGSSSGYDNDYNSSDNDRGYRNKGYRNKFSEDNDGYRQDRKRWRKQREYYQPPREYHHHRRERRRSDNGLEDLGKSIVTGAGIRALGGIAEKLIESANLPRPVPMVNGEYLELIGPVDQEYGMTDPIDS